MNPLVICAGIAGGVAAIAWLLSLLTREYSWVDRIWSIVPVVYLWVFAAASGFDPRVLLMAILVTLWGARLTVNFARKGGYAPGGEDYRWAALRALMKPWQFQLFNFFFIAVYQNVLLLLIALPGWTAYQHRGRPLGLGDVLAAVLFLLFLTGETVADQQQWNFHRHKKAERAAGREVRPGFLTTGLFRYSRHPNFFCEVSQWWVVYAFGAIAAGTVIEPTILGAVLLTLLFLGSTAFTEWISRSKYPEYEDYRRTTSALVPWWPRTGTPPASQEAF